ncbi:MAG: hypothetical protein Q4G36_08170 [Paracoccus sp. (in: a-proteobacteria)]|nr:hypothetical protein [Paracoccus sp. (in: a-proteobacteria)]
MKAALVQMGLSLALNFAASKLLTPKGPKPRDLQTTIRSGNAERFQHFGRVRVGGTLLYADWAQVGNRRRAFVLLAVSTGGITGVETWYLNGKPVEVDAGGWVQTDPWKNRIRLRLRKGRDDEYSGGDWAELRDAFPTRWTEDHRLDGVATILAEFDHVDPEQVMDVYPGGSPPEVTAVIRGAPVRDHHNDVWFYSENIPRQLRQYLLDNGLTLADLDGPVWSQAMADADELVPTQDGTRPRYHGGGSYGLAEPVKDVAGRMLAACAGHLYQTPEGLIGLRVGKYRPPELVIDARKIVSSDMGAGRDALDRVTTLVPQYVEPDLDYSETTADPWEDARAIARYGEPKPRELSLPWAQHHGQARALAKIHAAEVNPRITASQSLRFWGLRLIGQESVYLNRPELGLHMAPMRITGLSLDLDGSDGVVRVELESIDPAAFDWTAEEEGKKPAAPPRIGYTPEPILAPVLLDVRVAQDRVGLMGYQYSPVYITGKVAPLPGLVTVAQYRTPGNEWFAVASVDQETGVFRTPALTDGEVYDLRARRVRAGLSAILSGGFGDMSRDTTRYGPWTEVGGILVIANPSPPAAPALVLAEVEEGELLVIFRPALGANYARTGLYRGDTYAGAELIHWAGSPDSTVTIRVPLTATPTNYWLRSENGSGAQSAPTTVGSF